jgi:hypothetical protein
MEQEPTSGYSSEENGHAERGIRTLNDIKRLLLSDSGLSNKHWADALEHARHRSNLCSSRGLQTPWELLTL